MIDAETQDAFAELRMRLGAFLGPDVVGSSTDEGVARLSPGATPARSAAVTIMGVIDDAVPFAHPMLRTEGGVTRVASCWLMGAAATGARVSFGREITGPEIDALVAAHRGPYGGTDEESLYRASGAWAPGRGPLHAGGRRATHGAAVAGLLAGRGEARDAAGGPARDALDGDAAARPVIAACLPPQVTLGTEGTFLPWFAVMAIRHVVRRAVSLARWLELDDVPKLVINLSYGIAAGSKDGSGLVERYQEAVAREVPPELAEVRFVLPMGNHRQDRLRARLEAGEEVGLDVPPGDATPTFVEIWGRAGHGPVEVMLSPPCGPPARLSVPHGLMRELTHEGREVARAYGLDRAGRAAAARPLLTLAFPPTCGAMATGRAGRWRIALAPGAAPVDVHVQRDDAAPGFARGARQARLCHPLYRAMDVDGRPRMDDDPGCPVRRSGTVNAIATARSGQVRARAMVAPGTREATYSALAGPGTTPDVPSEGRAVTETGGALGGIPVPGTYAGARTRGGGTSLAAPQVARAELTEGTEHSRARRARGG